MAVKLNRSAYDQAQRLIKTGYRVLDNRGDWSAHEPSAVEETEFIRENDFNDYARWHLGVDEEKPKNTTERYEFPYGDFRDVRRSGVLAAQSRAGQYGYRDIELAAAHLLGSLDDGGGLAGGQTAAVRSSSD